MVQGLQTASKIEAQLWDTEERFWTEGADSARHMTAKNAVFVFPYPIGILSGTDIFREAHVAQRWRSIRMSETYCAVEGDVAVLAYRVSAERADAPIYEALCTSTYLRDNDHWLRLNHQQTNVR
jgi:hypothetical protein